MIFLFWLLALGAARRAQVACTAMALSFAYPWRNYRWPVSGRNLLSKLPRRDFRTQIYGKTKR